MSPIKKITTCNCKIMAPALRDFILYLKYKRHKAIFWAADGQPGENSMFKGKALSNIPYIYP